MKRMKRRLAKTQSLARKYLKAGKKRLTGRPAKTQRQASKDSRKAG